MRIFGRSKISKSSASRRSSAALATEPAAQPQQVDVADLARTDEMPIVRERTQISTYPAVVTPDVVESRTGAQHDPNGEDGDSDVFVCRRSSPDFAIEAAAAAAQLEASAVTLFVYGWENVEPGPLSWAFPSLRTALDAVKTMRNAIEWCIVAGHEWSSIEAARESGAVLIEQNA
jgi:hypothetical protein